MTSADPLFVVSFLFLAAVVWLIARAWRQNGVLLRVAPAPAPAGSMLPPLTVVVPARWPISCGPWSAPIPFS